jgi:hypothetical protein
MNPHDPSLTAHALGEPDAAVTEALAQDPALAAEAAEIQRFATRLRTEFQAEPALPLRDEQRAAVLSEARRIVEGPAHWWQRGWAATAAAACAVALVGAGIYFQAQHLAGLRPVAGRENAKPEGVKVRWIDDAPTSPPTTVLPPKAPVVATQPTYQAPVLQLPRTDRATDSTAPTPSLEHLPTMATQPALKVDPATVPMRGARPAAAGRSGVEVRIGSAPSPSPQPRR